MTKAKSHKINREYKDRLFRFIFKEPKDLLDLYNAMNDTTYQDVSKLEITTLEDAIYLGMKNDVSFIIKGTINLYEQQSSYNPNMPLRAFLYIAEEYQAYIDKVEANIYGTKLIRIPNPRCIVFYNGTGEQEERKELYLSDAFEIQHTKEENCVEFKVSMLNINLNYNRRIMEKCRKLREYSQFVAKVREGLNRGLSLDQAMEEAVESCIKEGILSDILRKNRAEVCDLLLTEYDEEKHIAMERRDAREEGKTEGEVLKVISLVRKKQNKGVTIEAIADALEETLEYIEPVFIAIQKNPNKSDEEIYKILKGI